MADSLRIKFGPIAAPRAGVLVVFCDDGLRIGSATRAALGPAVALIERVAGIEHFKGKLGSTLDIVAPADLKADRLVVVGLGKPKDIKPHDSLKLGGSRSAKFPLRRATSPCSPNIPPGSWTPRRSPASH